MRSRIILSSLLVVILAVALVQTQHNDRTPETHAGDGVAGERQPRNGCDHISALVLAKLEEIEERLNGIEERLDKMSSKNSTPVCAIEKVVVSSPVTTTATEGAVVQAPKRTVTEQAKFTVAPKPTARPRVGVERILKDVEVDKDKEYGSCRDVPSRVSGIFKIKMWNDGEPINVLCDLDPSDPGWIVIQNRFNGSVSFYRNWTDYEAGFGSLDGEFWFGLENISLMVNNGRQWEIKFWLKAFDAKAFIAKYGTFMIGTAAEGYELKQAGKYSGNAGDSLRQHLGMKFSTYDRDNDPVPNKNCAEKHRGAWWYHRHCVHSNLNALYGNVANEQSNCWHTIRPSWNGLQASKMMIRELR
ncbi:microfibril-associated glycoprotein 4-like [Anopheles stephensi]|uniref:microfibril-associated glycoprotein 4-like n=1 Tax=Anopheles stephensi TaxID=30069 RepID=UPI0016588B12|nr:microfibril-associated glycoprotein 4-like [Anopheles stephensi]